MTDVVIPLEEVFAQFKRIYKEFHTVSEAVMAQERKRLAGLASGTSEAMYTQRDILEKQQEVLYRQLRARIGSNWYVHHSDPDDIHFVKKIFHPSEARLEVSVVRDNLQEVPDKWKDMVGRPLSEVPPEPKPPRPAPVPKPALPEEAKLPEPKAAVGWRESVGNWAQENRVAGGIAGAAGVAAGAFMSWDGFKRLRRGLGYDSQADGKALQGSIAQAALGAGEMAAGVGLAAVGGYTGVMAFKGKGGPSTPSI